MLADLEESLGTFQVSCWNPGAGGGGRATTAAPGRAPTCPAPQSTKAVYDRILDLRIATPQIVINYAMFLEEHKYFEESFKVRRARQEVPGSGVPNPVPRALRSSTWLLGSLYNKSISSLFWRLEVRDRRGWFLLRPHLGL